MKKNKDIEKLKHRPIFVFYMLFMVMVSLLMLFFMWSVYNIPVQKIKSNALKSYHTLELTSRRPVPRGWYVDVATDALMINGANLVRQKSTLSDALLNPHLEVFGKRQMRKNLVTSVFTQDSDNIGVAQYPRFWHGYLVFLKPLLVFFDLKGIRIINFVFQLGMLLTVLYLMYKRLGLKHSAAFLGAIWFVNPVTSWMCLEFANVINVMLLAVLWVLLNKDPDDRYMFFVIGAVTILFDFFTFPLVTLGIPLIIYICLYERGFKDDVKCVVKNSLLWLFGYAGMWLMKWMLAMLLTDENVIKDVWENVVHRTYGHTAEDVVEIGDISIQRAISLNLSEMCTSYFLGYISVFLFLIAGGYFIGKYKLKKSLKAPILLGISLMPFVWYSVLVNHSVIHGFLFTYKILAVTAYAILAAAVCCFEPQKNN